MTTFEDMPDPVPTFVAQFDSTCNKCGTTLQTGQKATFDGNDAVHLKCPPKRTACPECWLVHGTHQEECDA